MATAPARRAGVRSRMPVSTAQYLCPDLLLLPHDPLREAAAFEPVAQAFDAVAAGVVCLRPGLAWAPAAGPARWMGSEEALAGALVEEVAADTGAECQVGIATGMLAALESAHQGEIVAPGDTAAFLSSLSVGRVSQVLPPAVREEVAHALDVLFRLGVHTCADLLGIGRGPLVTRFGRAGETLRILCAGGDLGARGMRRRRSTCEVSTEFDPPASDIDAIVMGLRRLAEDLAQQLWRSGVSSQTLTVWMETAAGQRRERTWTGLDCASTADVVDRVRWQLRGWTQTVDPSAQTPDSALASVGLLARELMDAPPGARLWGRADADDRATRSVLRLQSLLGDEAVVAPHLQGGHDPRSRILTAPWGSPVEGLTPVDGEWEGGVESPPATLFDVARPILLWGTDEDTAPTGGERGITLVTSEGHRVEASDARMDIGEVRGVSDDRSVRRSVLVEGRGALSVVPTHLLVLPTSEGNAITGLEIGQPLAIRVSGGPWAVLGRWWEGSQGDRSSRAYLRVVRDEGADLLLVQRQGRWLIEGIYD